MENLNQTVTNLTPQEKKQWAEHRQQNTKWEQENLKVELTAYQRHMIWLKEEIVKSGKRTFESMKGLNVQQLERIYDSI